METQTENESTLMKRFFQKWRTGTCPQFLNMRFLNCLNYLNLLFILFVGIYQLFLSLNNKERYFILFYQNFCILNYFSYLIKIWQFKATSLLYFNCKNQDFILYFHIFYHLIFDYLYSSFQKFIHYYSQLIHHIFLILSNFFLNFNCFLIFILKIHKLASLFYHFHSSIYSKVFQDLN